MLILVVEPDKVPYPKEINGTLEEMQQIVGGYIQAMFPFPDEVALICNEEGKIQGLPLNRPLKDEDGRTYDIVAGTFLLCGAPSGSDSFTGLTQEQVAEYERWFHSPQVFLHTEGYLICVPMELSQ